MLDRCKIAASAGSDAGPFLGGSGQDAQPVGRGIQSAFAYGFQVVTRITVVKGQSRRTVTESSKTRRFNRTTDQLKYFKEMEAAAPRLLPRVRYYRAEDFASIPDNFLGLERNYQKRLDGSADSGKEYVAAL
ncbi:hypothetical protein NW768_003470 [Fusarium equiseti]|uniref:Uncharacterized protein n=1 Tax=Fusarium equiseti TaxID=61235 RepID=A0ABQ8RHU7_FUSEQ|nr:hypothetical protein NW768_003470 [Fusarium equiseti]